ncbi:MAG TPA: transporter substrate-binding domain-containing protein [Azonexus sp.]
MAFRLFLLAGLLPLLLAGAAPAAAEPMRLKVAVLDDAPPLGFRDSSGQLTGFSIGVMRALCAEMAAKCDFEVRRLEHLIDDLAAGHFDVAAVGLLNTPERRQRIGFSRPVYRSLTVLFSRSGAQPGQPGVRLSVFKGSAQERYVKAQGWDYIGAQTDLEILEQLRAGVTQACIVPLMTSLNLQGNPDFLKLGVQMNVLKVAELDSNAAFGISPKRPELKAPLDKALEKIKLNASYDRINSQFLPFRVD